MEGPKVALITGGASGMGLELALHLRGRGWRISLLDIDATKGVEVAEKLGKQCLFTLADITSYDQLSRAFASTYATWKRIDLVAANAGITETRPSLCDYRSVAEQDLPPAPNLKVMEVNLTAALHTVWLASHYMLKSGNGWGRIIVTSSSAGIYPTPFQPLYAASKHALVGLVRSLGPILSKDGITINALLPGLVLTGLTKGAKSLPEFLTPTATVVKACERFIETNDTGLCAEISKDNIYLREQASYSDETQKRVLTKLAESATPDFTIP